MSEADKIEAVGIEVVAPQISDNSRHRLNNRQQDIRFEQRGNDQNKHQNNYSLNGFRNKNAQWNPPAPNTESHWDDLTTTNFSPNLKRRKNIVKESGLQKDNTVNPQTNEVMFSTESNTYEGNRREFVNSKNRMSLSSQLRGKNYRGDFQSRISNRRNDKYLSNSENGLFKDKSIANKTTINVTSGNLRQQTVVEPIQVFKKKLIFIFLGKRQLFKYGRISC